MEVNPCKQKKQMNPSKKRKKRKPGALKKRKRKKWTSSETSSASKPLFPIF